MAYLDPASNPRSKPQMLCATNCKSSTPDLLSKKTTKRWEGVEIPDLETT